MPSGSVSPGSPTPTPNAFGPYVGCFPDASPYGSPLFTGSSFVNKTGLTLESCAAFCSSPAYNGPFTYFGIMNGDTCKCGNTKPTPSPSQGAITCGVTCSGNPSQLCGGSNSDSVYEVAVLPVQNTPSATPGITPTPSLPVVSPSTPVVSSPGDTLTPSTPGKVPTATRLPYPNRPPSEVGDGVDYPYFPPPGYYYSDDSDADDGVYDYYNPGHHGHKPQPKPTRKPAYPNKPRPWKPRPTVRP